MENSKMRKVAGVLETLFKVVGGILAAMVVVCAIFAVLVLTYGEKMFVPDFVTLDIGFLKFYLTDQYRFITDDVKLYGVISLVTAAGLYGVASYVCSLLCRILKPMKEGRPFEDKTARYLRRAGWAILGGGLYMQVLRIVEEFLLTNAYPLREIFDSEAIVFMEHTITADFSFVLLACAFFLLSYIFSYGQVLQRQFDETL